jgi:transcriptional regulator with XRE-family HTH domain
VDITSIIRQRLKELGIEQRELALAADVTESYISQLLAKKKTPPAPDRTRIYEKIAKVLKLSSKELATLADEQRREHLRRKVIDPPRPLYRGFRELILRKCAADQKERISGIFEREPFGELERFVARQLLDVSKRAIREEWEDPKWPQRLARAAKRSAEETLASILEFLDTDVFHVSLENCLSLLDPLIQHWDIELGSFRMKIALNPKLTQRSLRTLSFREEDDPKPTIAVEPGLQDFLNDEKLSAGITDAERTFLSRLGFDHKRPSALYFYRELQNLRDPLNFFPVTTVQRNGQKERPRR